MRRFWEIGWDYPLSVVIGRIAVRVLIVLLIVWALYGSYKAYDRHRKAQEIAPVHRFAQSTLEMLKNGEYFSAQERLDPALKHTVSIDRLAHFADLTEINATNGGNWEEWSKKNDYNTTVYYLSGRIIYNTGRKKTMQWKIKREDAHMSIIDLKLGARSLKPPRKSPL